MDESVVECEADFSDQCPDADEELDDKFPRGPMKELQTATLMDADHGHDKKTWCSMTGLCVFVGSAPVQWMSRRQGAVETSTHGAEFCALRTAAEEAITIQCMLRSLGVKSPEGKPTLVFGDNVKKR